MRTVALALLPLAGCIDEFHGSNIQVDFSPAMPVQASAQATAPGPGELPSGVHFTLYAFSDGVDDQGNPVGNLFEVQQFEIHRVVDPLSPCFIDVGANVPVPGLHVTQFAAKIQERTGITDIANPPAGATTEQLEDVATALQRQKNVAALAGSQGPKVVSSVSRAAYPSVAADCSSPGIPPPSCTDDTSNQTRLELCQRAWRDAPALFEGTDRILTSPLSGTEYGMVDGLDPINLAPVGGAQFYVDEALENAGGYAIYYKQDSAPDTDLGTLLLFGRPERAITRGVIRVPMTSLVAPGVSATLAIFANLDDDEVQF